MTKEEIKDKVNQFLIEEFEIDPSKIYDEAHLKEDVGIDSLDYVDIVVSVKDVFGFKVQQEELQEIQTLSQFYDYIDAKLNG